MPRLQYADSIDSLLRRGAFRIGEVHVAPDFSLSHWEDVSKDDLVVSTDPWQALEIARYDDAGRYRALKTAANLRHGWRLQLASSQQVLVALDFLYPAAVGLAFAWQAGKLPATPLRVTLDRQTGMYAVVKKLTKEQAGEVIGGLCCGNVPCLRRKIWSIESGEPPVEGCGDDPEGRDFPLLCAEACNLFVAASRRVIKGEVASSND